MKTARIRNNNKKEQKEIITEEEYSMKKMILIISLLIIVFLIFYFITTLVVKPVKQDNKNNTITEIDSTKITLNHLLDRKESEYYVLATKNSLYKELNVNYETIYNKYIKDYKKQENALTFYKTNLDDALNKSFSGEETNITDNLQELKLSDEVLFKIKDGKIDGYSVGHNEIVKTLSSLKK